MASTHYSENDTLFPLAGGCACGFIRYELGRAPLIVNCCHCTACQRQTGSAFAINAVIESASIRLLPSAAPTFAGSAAKPEPTPAAVMPAFAASTDAAIPPALAGGGEQSKHQPKPLPVCIPSGSGLGTTVAQCPECRTGLWNHYADAGCHLSYVRVGTLDEPWAVAPDVHIYTRSRRSFIDISDGKPQFEDYYPSREALMREDALERVKAMKPLVEQWKAELKRKMKL